MKEFKYENLSNAPLQIDAIYKGGNYKDVRDDPLSKLLPKTGNMGGFRVTSRKDKTNIPAYVTIYTSMNEVEWPDYFNAESGIFRYYGDNRHPGNDLLRTPRGGNRLLENVFHWINNDADRINIPPFLIFSKSGAGRDVRFIGLAVPGNENIPPDRDLVSFWRTINDQRFQNYEAYFTVLDLEKEALSKRWLNELIYNHPNNLSLAPSAWKQFIAEGRSGIRSLKSPRIFTVPSNAKQLPDKDDMPILDAITEHYKDNPFGFEKCSTALIGLMDPNFLEFELTRPWRDGGIDALGKYKIGMDDHPLSIDCALEAKCYASNRGIGVREMSRLISRIKYRQFGIFVTTSYVGTQAYKEIVEDGHPIMVITGRDIVGILKQNAIDKTNVYKWLSLTDRK